MAQRQFRSDDTSLWLEGYGTSKDGTKTVSASADYDGAKASCSGTASSTSLTLGAASTFSNGDLVIIHQTRGTGAGAWELNKITSGAGTTSLTLTYTLTNTYTDSGASQAQIVEMKEYASLTVNSSQTWSAPSWDGDTGGILACFVKGAATITGSLSANTKGFRGGTANGTSSTGNCGEGTGGASSQTTGSNGNGGGAGAKNSQDNANSAAGGGHANAASNGPIHFEFSQSSGPAATGGTAVGNAGLTTMDFGGGGGGGGNDSLDPQASSGGNGGGIILIIAKTITISGGITTSGGSTTQVNSNHDGAGGGGAGGSILLKGQSVTLGSSLVTASAGSGAWGCAVQHQNLSTDGSVGRIHVDYLTTLSGSTTPTLDSRQDTSLVDVGGGGFSFMFL